MAEWITFFNLNQMAVFAVLLGTLFFFIQGKLRYDLVALLALMTLTLIKIIPAQEAFSGFSHPAVITVAAILVIGKGLQNSGLVSLVAKGVGLLGNWPTLQIGAMTCAITLLSGFMNNVGALVVFMPVAMEIARKSERPPSIYLMPLAFGSLLGGMMTLIGTPPNIIVSTFRKQISVSPFEMFDFMPVGSGIAVAGVLFLSLIGWRLLPQRKGAVSKEARFEIESYITEVRVTSASKMVGKKVQDVERLVQGDVSVIGIVRDNRKFPDPPFYEVVVEGDILIVKADSQALKELSEVAVLEIMADHELGKEILGSDEVVMMEAVVMPGSTLVRRSAKSIAFHDRFGIHLLAVAREGMQLRERFDKVRFMPSDILLFRGSQQQLDEAFPALNCLPLAHRDLRIGQKRSLLLSLGLFSAGVALVTFEMLSPQIAFSCVALSMILFSIINLREVYEAIDWPIIVLLGAMIPVGEALETTGGAKLIAEQVVLLSNYVSPPVVLGAVLIFTMCLSDVVNNATAAILMAPIAARIATGIGVAVDPFLMSVAIGASCAFLTPVGHQSSALVMGPGGYKFSDYWRVGLPLEIIVAAVSVPLILKYWPL